ncbi:Protein FAR1-RELATED SEQUENCE 5 [Platanthera zijinensis]|uniref:Protein FAR1-RELATED SEQUENCE 5 n=1 Tax=Platanthera zijinensis TaxID=2320716 RepID=A0AAP0FW65_9ASPA
MKEQVGGYENVGFTCVDARNYVRDLKALIADSDAQMFIQNFKNLQQHNSSFYYAYELDADDHLKCVFWADEIARNNFSVFGDLLSFDTTYNTNKYSMIFAPFTGLNHHRLSISFGAALLANEKTESFCWLFEKFLDCMGANEPVLIVTDQDPAMRSAIEKTFKTTKHRFCMWHIMKKLSEKVGGDLNANINFQRRFKSCVWNSETSDEFETNWSAIISDYNLSHNDWLLHMFELRKMWIPVYLQDIPLSGLLRTTSRSESENSFFGNFVNNKLGLIEFYSRFDNAMEAQRQRELKAEHKTLNGKPNIRTGLAIEKHASSLYTHKNFFIFQDELWASCIGCGVKSSQELNDSCTFIITNSSDPNNKYREVVYSSSNTTCSCKMFESQGIPCRHILLVLKGQGINELPAYCITPRWGKLATSKPNYEEPYVGQIFNDLDAIYNFYNAYARKLGFGVRKNSSTISKVSGKRIWKNYVCDKAGVKFCRPIDSSEEIKRLRETRSCCLAKLDVRKFDDDKWIVTNFIKEHNHELDTPRRTLKHRSHHISHKNAIAKSLMKQLHGSGIGPSIIAKTLNATGLDNNISAQNVTDHVRNQRKYQVGFQGQYVYQYLQTQQAKDPNFYFSLELDNNEILRSIFCADSCARNDYIMFGDVIIFDVTYKTNNLSLSFAPFTGVNHHRKSILLGCVLLFDETEETFTWLFQ